MSLRDDFGFDNYFYSDLMSRHSAACFRDSSAAWSTGVRRLPRPFAPVPQLPLPQRPRRFLQLRVSHGPSPSPITEWRCGSS